jgi:tetratricopeptide (TPR) repeat protein
MVWMRLKRLNEALADADAAVALAPDSVGAYFYRGRLRVSRREFPEARADFERALERSRGPQFFLLNGVAWFFATCPDQSARDGRRAVDLATKACEVKQWKDDHALDTLAAAYAETGDFDQAIKWQSQALKLYGDAGDSRSGMQKRLALYKQHKAYREVNP